MILEPGDVDEEGDIQTADPSLRIRSGVVLVTPEQAFRATLHGYSIVAVMGDLVKITKRGKEVEDMKIEINKVKRPDEALRDLGELFRTRNAVYGDTYKDFGKIMAGFFKDPVTFSTEEEWNRLALFFHVADKLGRYAKQFFQGGHPDSLDDISVYAQLLYHCDAILAEERKREAEENCLKASSPHPSEDLASEIEGTFGKSHPIEGEYYWMDAGNGHRVVSVFRGGQFLINGVQGIYGRVFQHIPRPGEGK